MNPARTLDGVRIRELARSDLARVLEIERASFSVPWRLHTFQGLLDRLDTDLLAAVDEQELIGYAICWTVLDQAELGNVAVSEEGRRRGVGRQLVEAALARARSRGAFECFLEVRESNLAAQRLYEQCGFAVIGRRKRYYSNPAEDALVMRATV